MRYLRLDPANPKRNDIISGTIVNMLFNKHLYDENGFIGDNKNYNIYSFNGVKYNAHITSVIVYYITNKYINQTALRDDIIKKMVYVESKGIFNHKISNGVVYPGIIIKNNNKCGYGVVFNTTDKLHPNSVRIFTPNTAQRNKNVFFQYTDEYPECGHNMLSILIVDEAGILQCTKNKLFRGPSLRDYSCVRNGNVCNKTVRVLHGLYPEIYDILLGKKYELNSGTFTCLFWLHWSKVQPKKRNMNIGWIDQLKMGNLYEQKNLDHDHCFISGVPIFEDCYVIDIYEEKQVLNVSETLPNDTIIKTIKRKSGITYTVIRNKFYDSYQILLSPAVFLVEPKLINILELHNFKYICYRTFSPKLAHHIIENLDEDIEYKNVLHMFNNGYTNNRRILNDNTYKIINCMDLRDLITTDEYKYVINKL